MEPHSWHRQPSLSRTRFRSTANRTDTITGGGGSINFNLQSAKNLTLVRQVGKTYRAEETEVPAAAKTVAISACAKEMKHCTTAVSNCVPLDSMRRRTASS